MNIRSRLEDLPIYESHDIQVASTYFNLVMIALKRLNKSIRFELPKLRSLDMILEEDAWVVIDRSLNDIPVIAWVDFSVSHRSNLHEPIACQRRSYHAHALIIIDKVMEAMQLTLKEKLNTKGNGKKQSKIILLKKPY